MNFKDTALTSTPKLTKQSTTGHQLGGKKGKFHQKSTVMAQLKDPEPGLHADKVRHRMRTTNQHKPAITAPELGGKKANSHQKSTVMAQLTDPKPGHDTDKVRHPMKTVNEHKPVQDLVIHLTNPDLTTPKLAVSAGLKRKIDDFF